MKILHAAETIKGGVATVIKHLTLGALRSDSKIQVRCFVPSSQIGDLEGIPDANIMGFTASGRGLSTSLSFLLSLIHAVWKYRPDVVHLHSSFAGAIGRIILLFMRPFCKCKVIYSPHAFAFTMEIPAWKRRLYALIERILAHVTDAIVCTCQHELSAAEKHGLNGKKLILIHNGAPGPNIAPAFNADTSASVLQLLFVGRFDFQKGFDILLDAMRLLEKDSIRLTAIGANVHGGIIAEPRPNIQYAGWVRLSELPNYYQKSHLLVIPSRWEGFAMVPLEALSNGLPVLASSHPSFNETVVSGVTGYRFTSENAAMLAEKLRTMKTAELVSMRGKCHLHYQKNFRVEIMVQRTLTLYENLFHA